MNKSFYPKIKFVADSLRKGEYSIEISIKRLICFGWSGRVKEKVMEHVKELAKLGIPGPKSIPEIYLIPPYLAYTGDYIEVYTKVDSGEVEYVLLFSDEGEIYVSVGSDHTDRVLERFSIEKSKQIYPKVIAPKVWLYEEVIDHWDDLILRSRIKVDERMEIYQEDCLKALIRPEEIMKIIEKYFDLRNMAIFSGTIPTKKGEVVSTSFFEMEFVDPILRRVIKHSYKIKKILIEAR